MKTKSYRHSIISEEEEFIIINKPPYISVIPDRYNTSELSLIDLLRKEYPELLVVHRLDKQTSGAMVFAKTKEMHRSLSMMFQDREVSKTYHAIVFGEPIEKEGVIEARISRMPNNSGQFFIIKDGREAITHYKVIEELKGGYFLVEFKIITGRTHQIRLHALHAGFPLAVDEKYGYQSDFYLSTIKKRFNLGKFEEERPLFSRNSLHARFLKFEDPNTCEKRRYKADHFKDFKAMLNQLNTF